MKALLFAALFAFLLAACASLPERGGEAPADLDRLLADAQRVAALPAEEQRGVLSAARQRHAERQDARAAVGFALLLSLPGTPFQDDEEAARVLEPYAEARQDASSVRRYAALLRSQLMDKARWQLTVTRLRETLSAMRTLPAPAVALGDEEVRQVASLVAYAHGISGLPAEAQRNEFFAVNVAYAERPSDFSRIRLALLLSLPGTAVQDDARALKLLEPYKGAASASPLPQFGALLHRQVGERARDRKRSAQLKEQLEALRGIERSLIERRQKQ